MKPDHSTAPALRQVRLLVNGIVQGVGFRPFLHRLAGKHGITGWVRNTSAGVEGVLEGTEEDLNAFLLELKTSPPPMAQLESVAAEACQIRDGGAEGPEHFTGFTIRDSRIRPGATLIAPDTAMCPDCEAELQSPSDRRYRYPFINCTNCGPRYTIIESLPYDRERTVMKDFPMCPDCTQEYGDIRNRRYHAQPDCCPVCGPGVFFLPSPGSSCSREGNGGGTIRSGKSDSITENEAAFAAAQELLSQGGILAVKGIGGIHLACSGLDPEAVLRLRRKKHRAEKPLALMCRSLKEVRSICSITPAEEKLLTSPARPIVLLAKRRDLTDPKIRSALDALSFSSRLGVMLPYTPLHFLLLDGTYGGPGILVMTSGNVPGCPVLTGNEEALEKLSGTADGFLLHNRAIANRCDDSLIAEWKGQPYFLRRSRGYAPAPVRLRLEGADVSAGGIAALGAEQKASFALGRGSRVFLSPYIGDLKNAETFQHYSRARETFERLFRLRPDLYVCDLHPDYLSTSEARRLADARGIPLLQVQHHWAHMASCMADNGLSRPCFGIIWDGTGLGMDGTVWGGEFLTGDLGQFQRTGSIRPVALPGGDRASEEIGRIALSLVLDAFGKEEVEHALSFVPLPAEKCRLLAALIRSGSVPLASSIGRLFDGICALLLNRQETDYEGEGAALTEALSPLETPDPMSPEQIRELSYPLSFYEEKGVRFFDTRPMIRELLAGLKDQSSPGASRSLPALRFLCTLICMALDQCLALNPDRLPVVLSGGVFQNRFLLHGITSMLEGNGFSVFTHRRVSTNDEGIAFGQLAVAAEKRSMNHVSGNANENH